jgi:hypothetical protein
MARTVSVETRQDLLTAIQAAQAAIKADTMILRIGLPKPGMTLGPCSTQ